ncbi:MAG: hypothetical protein K0R98_637 [Rickettsiaceae bacterium]|jgi:hypothetical protein|nr:hypothetical protein [Rickettsiaceae bacterium]
MKRLYLVLFLVVLLGFSRANAACLDDSICEQESFEIAQNSGLSPSIIDMIQQQYNGRVVSVTPSAGCKEATRGINIDGKNVQAYDTACQGADGSWNSGAHYDVQVMSDGRVIIVTISQNGSILKVQQ